MTQYAPSNSYEGVLIQFNALCKVNAFNEKRLVTLDKALSQLTSEFMNSNHDALGQQLKVNEQLSARVEELEAELDEIKRPKKREEDNPYLIDALA